MENKYTWGHVAGFVTILIWGTTFISTKVLLEIFTPIEILFIRFLIGYIALWCVSPCRLRLTHKSQEWYFIFAGLCGVTLYYLFENIALTYTLASNVGVIISIAPFFTALCASLFLHEKWPGIRFYIGFVLAMGGIILISLSNGTSVEVNPLGDILAVIAAMIWAVYSTITKKITGFGYRTTIATRHSFFYGLIFMIPVLCFMNFDVSVNQFLDPVIAFNFIFLGLGASALCFVTWNYAVKILGSVKTSVYIYMVPVITTIASAIILHEKITLVTVIGIVLTLIGLFLSEKRGN